MPKKKSIHYPQEQSLKPFWCVLVWKESQLGIKNYHIPSAQNDEYPHFKRGLPVDYWIHQSRGSNPNVPLKVLIMYVTNISLQVQIEVVRNFETTAHITKPPKHPLIMVFWII